jgi:hypothetical protein
MCVAGYGWLGVLVVAGYGWRSRAVLVVAGYGWGRMMVWLEKCCLLYKYTALKYVTTSRRF